MEKARQHPAVIRSCDHRKTFVRTCRRIVAAACQHRMGKPPLHMGQTVACAQNIDLCAQRRAEPESLSQHYAQFALEVFENKEFLPMLSLREVDIALSKGQGGTDHRRPCITEGRQEQWYKEYWLLQLRRLWRLLLCRAARTGLHPTSRRMQLHNSRLITTSWFTHNNFYGRAYGPVLSAPLMFGGADG